MKVYIKSKYVDEEVELKFSTYDLAGTTIQAVDPATGEPVFTATVKLPGERITAGCVFLKGWSENEGIPEALVKAGVVELTGRTAQTGFAEAIEAKLLAEETKP